MGNGTFLKQPKQRAKKSEPKKPQPQPTLDYRDSSSVAQAIDGLASIFSTYVTQARNGDNGSGLYSDPSCYPVKVALEQGEPIQFTLSENDYDDTLDRLVTAFERIADSVAKLAGLSRPRLEHWHEQEEYRPRYRDSACDGGAPGPKASTRIADTMAARATVEKTTQESPGV